MTTSEFSNEFDIQFNNIASNQAPGLDSYEKSVFLTKAQEEIVIALYSDKDNDLQSFERTEELRRYLDSLIKTYSGQIEGPSSTDITLSRNSKLVKLPEDLWFITYEAVRYPNNAIGCFKNKEIEVTPVTQDEFHRIKDNPFRGANSSRILRLDYTNGTNTDDKTVSQIELVFPSAIIASAPTYIVRYVAKVKPIILETLTGGLSINNETTAMTSRLHPALHRLILDRAVKLAIASFTQNLQ